SSFFFPPMFVRDGHHFKHDLMLVHYAIAAFSLFSFILCFVFFCMFVEDDRHGQKQQLETTNLIINDDNDDEISSLASSSGNLTTRIQSIDDTSSCWHVI